MSLVILTLQNPYHLNQNFAIYSLEMVIVSDLFQTFCLILGCDQKDM